MDLTSVSPKGLVLTTQRKRLLEHITKHAGLFSARDLMKSFPHMDKVTVYRNLKLFAGLDIIDPVAVMHGEQYYEFHREGGKHHHHIVCSKCSMSKCVPCHEQTQRVSGFTNIHHSVALSGVCVNCA